MGIRCVAIRACRGGKIDTGVPRMAVCPYGAAAVVMALLSAAIALHWSPLLAGTGRDRLCGRADSAWCVQRRGASGAACLTTRLPAWLR